METAPGNAPGNILGKTSESASGNAAGMSQTDWSMIGQAVDGQSPGADAALEQLARRYWPAIYAFIRASGRDIDIAADLTQGFVCDVMIDRNLFQVADRKRGRFRNLLLTALRNYLRSEHRSAIQPGRAPRDRKLIRLNEKELNEAGAHTHLTPDAAFCAQWSVTLVRRVLDQVRAGCLADNMEQHWLVFEHRVVRPMLLNQEPEPYEHLLSRLDLQDVAQASNMMVTVKRRFARAICVEVGSTVNDPSLVEDEIRLLLNDLERPT